jgi:UDP-N-acetylglucosamine:LPS N-acetylglucosamine transferase
LPVVLSGAIPFQETPNAHYVVQHAAGLYAPGARRVAAALAALFSDDGARLARLSEGMRALAAPEAIWRIAEEIAALRPAIHDAPPH